MLRTRRAAVVVLLVAIGLFFVFKSGDTNEADDRLPGSAAVELRPSDAASSPAGVRVAAVESTGFTLRARCGSRIVREFSVSAATLDGSPFTTSTDVGSVASPAQISGRRILVEPRAGPARVFDVLVEYGEFTAEFPSVGVLEGRFIDDEGRGIAGIIVETDRVPTIDPLISTDGVGAGDGNARCASSTTDADGRFFVFGLPDGPVRILVNDDEFRGADGTRFAATFNCPGDIGEITLRRLPVLVGWVVRAVDQAPAVGARVTLDYNVQDEGFCSGAQCDDHGEFRIAHPGVATFDLEFVDPSGAYRFVRHVRAPADGQLGMFELPAPLPRIWKIVTGSHRPIAGAEVRLLGDHEPTLLMSSDEGGAVKIPPSLEGALCITAPGFRTERVTISRRGVPDERKIFMSKTTRLSIRVDGASADAGSISAHVARVDGVFPITSADGRPDPCALAQYLRTQGGRSAQAHSFVARVPATIDGLSDGVVLTVTYFDSAGNRMADDSVQLASGEEKTLVLKLDRAPSRFFGRVVDRAGRGVAKAIVTRRSAIDEPVETVTDGDGHFKIEGSYVDFLTVDVVAKGFAERRGIRLDPADADHATTVVLEAARSLMIEVVDEAGRPQAHVKVTALIAGGRISGAPSDSPGLFLIEHIGEGACEIVVESGGSLHREEVADTTVGKVTIRLPESGDLTLDLSALPGDFASRWTIERTGPGPLSARIVGGSDPNAAPKKTFEFAGLLPGRYVVRVAIERKGEKEAALEEKVAEIVVGRKSTVVY